MVYIQRVQGYLWFTYRRCRDIVYIQGMQGYCGLHSESARIL